MKVRCPSCENVMPVEPDHIGETITCVECGATLSVPVPAAQTAAVVDETPRERTPRNRSGGGDGVFQVLAAPGGGAMKALWLGLVLIVATFAVKQVIISLTMWNAGSAIETPRLMALRASEMEKVDRDSDGWRDRREAIGEKYERIMRENRGEESAAGASAIGKLQWYCYLKPILDLVRLLGAILVLFAALHIAMDRSVGTWAKAYGVVCGGIAFFMVAVGGLLAFLG